MTYEESWMDKHFGLTILFIFIGVVISMIFLAVLVLIPEKNKEIDSLRNMDCNTIKQHLANEDFGWMLDESRYNAQFIWRCTK